MRVLIVCSSHSGKIAPFIEEQVDALKLLGVEIDYFLITRKGILGYLNEYSKLLIKIKKFKPQLIHAHYGLSGLLANLQRRIPVVTTYLGSDINYPKVFFFSKMAMFLSVHNIFVSEKNKVKSSLSKNQSLIPFGVITQLFQPMDKADARKLLGLDSKKKMVLFAGNFNNKVKNYALAKAAVDLLPEVELISLGKGYSREQVVALMNAVDVALMTSHSEGSPQFIKEVMACNCPIVSVDVGDVADVVSGVEGCYIANYDTSDLAEKLQFAINFGKRTEGRKCIAELKFDSGVVAERVLSVYSSIITNPNTKNMT